MQEHKNFSYLCVPTPIYFNYIIELLRVTFDPSLKSPRKPAMTSLVDVFIAHA